MISFLFQIESSILKQIMFISFPKNNRHMYATCYCVYAIYKVISVLYKQSGGYKKMHKFDYKKRTTH